MNTRIEGFDPKSSYFSTELLGNTLSISISKKSPERNNQHGKAITVLTTIRDHMKTGNPIKSSNKVEDIANNILVNYEKKMGIFKLILDKIISFFKVTERQKIQTLVSEIWNKTHPNEEAKKDEAKTDSYVESFLKKIQTIFNKFKLASTKKEVTNEDHIAVTKEDNIKESPITSEKKDIPSPIVSDSPKRVEPLLSKQSTRNTSTTTTSTITMTTTTMTTTTMTSTTMANTAAASTATTTSTKSDTPVNNQKPVNDLPKISINTATPDRPANTATPDRPAPQAAVPKTGTPGKSPNNKFSKLADLVNSQLLRNAHDTPSKTKTPSSSADELSNSTTNLEDSIIINKTRARPPKRRPPTHSLEGSLELNPVNHSPIKPEPNLSSPSMSPDDWLKAVEEELPGLNPVPQNQQMPKQPTAEKSITVCPVPIDPELKAKIDQWVAEAKKEGDLDLSNKNIGDSGLIYLSQLDLSFVDALYLNNNNITDVGLEALSKCVLPNTYLIYLSENPITSVGINALLTNAKTNLLGFRKKGIPPASKGIYIPRLIDKTQIVLPSKDLQIKILS